MNTTTPAVRGTVYGVILNDRDSLARMGGLLEDAPYKGAPMSPPLYLKPANTVVGDGARVRLPAGATAVEVGATLGVRFSRPAARLTAAEAPAVIAGYVVVADLSLPHSSYYRPAIREKCFDGACPVGARLVSPADAGELARVVINTWIDGELAQSRCLAELVVLAEPTLGVLLGQGTGGGALALMPADRVISAQHSWLSPLPPEGASAILYRDTAHAPVLAAQQRVRSTDLLADGIVHRIVAERPDAADEPEAFCQRLAQVIAHELGELSAMKPASRLAARHSRYRNLGLG